MGGSEDDTPQLTRPRKAIESPSALACISNFFHHCQVSNISSPNHVWQWQRGGYWCLPYYQCWAQWAKKSQLWALMMQQSNSRRETMTLTTTKESSREGMTMTMQMMTMIQQSTLERAVDDADDSNAIIKQRGKTTTMMIMIMTMQQSSRERW